MPDSDVPDDRPGRDAPYRDPSRPVEERVDDLLSRMTVEERIWQLTAAWFSYDSETGEVAPSNFAGVFGRPFTLEDAFRHGVGQITRPLGSQPVEPAEGARLINALQRRLVEETRLGIPAICHEECLTGLMAQGATSFPSPLNFASTWDPELIGRVGDVIRRQMRSAGSHQGLAPVADVARDPRWGRIEETLGEDTYLVARMVCAYVGGLQGHDPTTGVIATLKHFCGYSFSEGGRNFAPTHVGRRELEDVFLFPFEAAITEVGAGSVMNSYQEIDGEAPAASRFLLTEVLRDRWGFEGFTVADYGAVGFLYSLHGVVEGPAQAAAAALRAGLDVELPNPVDYPSGLADALERGLCDREDLDRAVRRVLRAKFRLGLFEAPYVDPEAVDFDGPGDRALAAEVAARSLVLLSNPDGVLPLALDRWPRVAVLGPNADDPMALFGNYSFENHLVSTHFPDARDVVDVPTILEELRSRLGEDRVTHAAGCHVMQPGEGEIEAAAQLAAEADLAVVVLGDKAGHFRLGTVGEGTDTTDLSLPGSQGVLLEAVLATGTPTVVVLCNGRPFALPGVPDRAAAILEAWFPGQAGSAAVVDALLGVTAPAGRSPVTFSTGAGVQPLTYDHKPLGPGFPRHPDVTPVFPFGHGLTYTTFVYSELEVSEEVPVDGTVEVALTVTNAGDRDGEEVVQLYVRDPVASVTRPVAQLRGFARVAVPAGESVRVRFGLPTDLLAFCGPDLVTIIEPGRIEIRVGASSDDIRLEGATEIVGAQRVVTPPRRLATSVTVDRAGRG